MNDREYRKFVLTLLDDENGIREEAYQLLAPEMDKRGCADICGAVNATEGRAYINEDYAAEEMAKVEEVIA